VEDQYCITFLLSPLDRSNLESVDVCPIPHIDPFAFRLRDFVPQLVDLGLGLYHEISDNLVVDGVHIVMVCKLVCKFF